jgi:hypothetical protein
MAELCDEASITPSKNIQGAQFERRHDQRVELRADLAPLFRLDWAPQSDFELWGCLPRVRSFDESAGT